MKFIAPLFLTLVLSAVSAEEPPNILFILADDLGYGDLGCYGQKLIATPNLDRLAREGLRFTQAYAGGTVCAASRSCLMTGLHNGHTRVRDNVPHDIFLRKEDVTLAEVMKQAGYQCGGIGKWSLGDADSEGRATQQGFDHYFGYLNQDHAHYYYPAYLDDDEGRLELPDNPTTHEFYSHHLMSDRALQFIRENRSTPFFFYCAYTLPHFSSPKEDPTRLAIPSDDPYSDELWTQKEKNYAAMITLLDRDVGRLVDLIDELNLTENTLVIFTSDNGPWGGAPTMFDSSGPLRGVKRDLYEGGIRVPFIVRWPGKIPQNKTSDEIIAFWDMLPTFAHLVGAETPLGLDGKNALDALLGKERATPLDHLYWDYGHCRNRFSQAVRKGNWKAVRPALDGPTQLYNLATDQSESEDLALSHLELVRELETIMDSELTPSPHYPIGKIYRGTSSWVKSHSE